MKVAALALALLLSGCATVGKEVSRDQMSGFKEGQTTQEEVISRLGQPTLITNSTDRTIMVYSFTHAQARPASFIPIVGLFAGGADVRSSSASFVFGKDGKLERQSHTATKT